ncbi:tetratricopeptide repeat protein [Planctomicrobium piriforme]|uniref:Tetratricopeptide repeat-containing protein n=1 Tax=Planctomicrobium piriforme TaxID=1576369 RepID=A0A1I3QXZ8_9PLAN|nr:tetratricopeptide repeat protein [Planctomicrobium piriforme]SFJ38352.1 Tetratricopeptide repeat-containing protein [Planctomicrobium piriforme]
MTAPVETRRRISLPAWLIAVGLVLLTCLAYFGVTRNGFVNYDDGNYVFRNPHVLTGLSGDNLKYAWTTFDMGNWMPATWMSLQLDAALFGVSPLTFHLTNLLLHCANVLLFFWWLRNTTGPGTDGRCGIAAALFAVHPLHVESVAWIAERKDVLSTFWLLAALLAYGWYAGRPAVATYLMFLFAAAAGLLSKPMLVTLPLLLLLVDYWPLRRCANWSAAASVSQRSLKWVLIEKLPVFLMAGATAVVTIMAQAHTAAVAGLNDLPITARLANVIQAYAWYLLKTFLPTRLCVHYLHTTQALPAVWVTLEAIVLLLFLGWILASVRKRPWVFVGGMWFFISLLPVIGLLQVGLQAYADRYAYVPHLGLFILIVWQTWAWLEQMSAKRAVAGTLAATAVVVCTWLTVIQVGYWKDTSTLFERVIQLDPNNWLAHGNLATERYAQRNYKEAELHFLKAIQLHPMNDLALTNLALLYIEQQRPDSAAPLLDAALRIDPRNPRAVVNRARVSRAEGKLEEAQKYYEQMRTLQPDHLPTRLELAQVYGGLGDPAAALKELLTATEMEPGNPDLRNQAAMLLFQLKRPDEAAQQLRVAIQSAPKEAYLHDNLSALLEETGDFKGALQAAEEALRLAPSDAAHARVDQLRANAANQK